jgi:N-acetylglucosamine malate deacetylase 1
MGRRDVANTSPTRETVVLALGAHPDDLEGACGGTLALLARTGTPVHMAVLTGGEHGVKGMPPGEARTLRLREAAQSAELAGAAGFHDVGVEDLGVAAALPQARVTLVALIRRLRANLLITHPPGDYHPDHRAAAELALDVRISSAVPGLSDRPPLEDTADLVFMDAGLGLGFEPHVWIDVDDVIELRRAMIAAHESQRTLLHGQDLAATTEALAALRGAQRGCRFAEAFRGCGAWPAPDGGIRRLVALIEGREGAA